MRATTATDAEINATLRKVSGDIHLEGTLESFLYTLMRDHVPPGTVQELVADAVYTGKRVAYTNGFLAEYAEFLANMLRK